MRKQKMQTAGLRKTVALLGLPVARGQTLALGQLRSTCKGAKLFCLLVPDGVAHASLLENHIGSVKD